MLLCVRGATASETFNYLILSLIGDRVTVINSAPQVGSGFDRSPRNVVPLKDSVLDDFAGVTAKAVILKLRPGASITLLRATDPGLYSLRDSWLEAGSVDAKALSALVTKLFSPPADARLLLVAPYRDELELKSENDYRGTETKAGGLGFYVDGHTRFRRSDTQETSIGFLGVFANFQLVLVKLDEASVDSHERIVIGTTFAASRAPDKMPWNALSADDKVKVLERLIRSEIDRALPAMIAGGKP